MYILCCLCSFFRVGYANITQRECGFWWNTGLNCHLTYTIIQTQQYFSIFRSDANLKMESNSTLPSDATFFVAKATNMNSLRGCHGNGIWACTPRKTPPQPKDILTEAMDRGPVVLLYSVNNCHGWHGYAEMITKPGTETKHMDINEENTTKKDEEQVANQSGERTSSDEWQRFRVKWMKAYLDENGEKCLPSSKTVSLSLPDGTPINNARNFQKVSPEVGYEVCQMIDDHLQELDECRKKKMAEQEARRPAAFFMADEKKEDRKVIWERLTKKVESMGTILLACAFGSQRYDYIFYMVFGLIS